MNQQGFQTNNIIPTSYANSSMDFLNSNSIIAKLAFLLLVLLLFVFLLRLGINLLGIYYSPSKNPMLINGMIDATTSLTITQDPALSTTIPIVRSSNGEYGIEFTWSVWIYIKNSQASSTSGEAGNNYRNIFYKGTPFNDDISSLRAGTVYQTPNIDASANVYDDITTNIGLNFPNNAPGLYLSPYNTSANDLLVLMNTYTVINEEVVVKDLPIEKWVNIIVRCEGNTLDVFINGNITTSTELIGIPKQNNGDVYVAANNGFNGYISNLQYFSHALSTNEIVHLVKKGPNIKMVNNSSNTMNMKNPNYISLQWFLYDNVNQPPPTEEISS